MNDNEKEILVSEQVLQVPYCYSAGPVAGRFLEALRDERIIYGIKCPSCARVYVPPRAVCGRCFTNNEEWVSLSGEGVVESFTDVYYHESVHPVQAPYTIAIIILDGADTGLVHMVRKKTGKELEIGTRVRAVFANERKGHILDISYFEPIQD